MPSRRQQRLVVAVQNQNVVVVEIAFQRSRHVLLGPFAIERILNMTDRVIAYGDVFYLAQDVLAAIDQRLRKQRLLVFDRHHVGAFGRGEHGDHDAADGDSDNDADRHHHAQARAVPARIAALVVSLRATWTRHRFPLNTSRPLHFSAPTLSENACHSLSFSRTGHPGGVRSGNSRGGLNGALMSMPYNLLKIIVFLRSDKVL